MTEASHYATLHSKVFLRGELRAETGLHIGGSDTGLGIGGPDNVVIRDPLDHTPYVPGSSLRGKLRSLLERARGLEGANGDAEGGFALGKDNAGVPGRDPSTALAQLFGITADQNARGPSRLIVRDTRLTPDSYQALMDAPGTDMPMTEVKTEVNIDRITSAATPRHFERVPAGARFDFELVITVMAADDRQQWLNLILEGLDLLQDDTLGGNGSRGYGRISVDLRELLERDAQAYREGREATRITDLAIPPALQGHPEATYPAAATA